MKFKLNSNFSTYLLVEESMVNVKTVKRKSSKISLTFEKEDFQINPFSLVINSNRENLLFPRLYNGYMIFTNNSIDQQVKSYFNVIDNVNQRPRKPPEKLKTNEQKHGSHKDKVKFKFDSDHYNLMSQVRQVK